MFKKNTIEKFNNSDKCEDRKVGKIVYIVPGIILFLLISVVLFNIFYYTNKKVVVKNHTFYFIWFVILVLSIFLSIVIMKYIEYLVLCEKDRDDEMDYITGFGIGSGIFFIGYLKYLFLIIYSRKKKEEKEKGYKYLFRQK
jgi:hypothetical protein